MMVKCSISVLSKQSSNTCLLSTVEQKSLNWAGPLTHTFFSIVNTIVPCGRWFVESADLQPQILRNHGYGGPGNMNISYTRIFDSAEGWHP